MVRGVRHPPPQAPPPRMFQQSYLVTDIGETGRNLSTVSVWVNVWNFFAGRFAGLLNNGHECVIWLIGDRGFPKRSAAVDWPVAMRCDLREREKRREEKREREREFRHKCCVTSKNTIFLIGFKPRPLIHHWLRACTWTCVMLSKSHELNIWNLAEKDLNLN